MTARKPTQAKATHLALVAPAAPPSSALPAATLRRLLMSQDPFGQARTMEELFRVLSDDQIAEVVTYLPPVRAVAILHAATARLAAPDQFRYLDHVDLGIARESLATAASQLATVRRRGGPR